MDVFRQLAIWRQSKTGLLVFAAIELLGATAFVLLALREGNWIDWICAVLLIFLAAQDIARYVETRKAA